MKDKWISARVSRLQKTRLEVYCEKHGVSESDLIKERLKDILDPLPTPRLNVAWPKKP